MSQFPELAKLSSVQTALYRHSKTIPPRKKMTLTVKGDLRSAQEVINCIAYPFCGDQVQTLSGDLQGQVEMNVNLELTDDEMASLPKTCPWHDFSASLLFKARSDSAVLFPDLKKTKVSKQFAETYQKLRVPANLPEVKRSVLKLAIKTADRQIEVKHYERAAQTLLKTFSIAMKPYRLMFSDSSFNGCVTKPSDLTVVCSVPANACDLMWTLRHEAEHIQQFARREYCTDQETGSLFDSHIARERSAYVNDMLNAEVYCPRKLQEQIKNTSILSITNRYLKN